MRSRFDWGGSHPLLLAQPGLLSNIHPVDDCSAVMTALPRTSRSAPESLGKFAHFAGRLRPWVELAKPGITRLVVVTAAFGAVLAPDRLSLARWVAMIGGTALVVAAANALNQVAEVAADRLMVRTAQRPLPTGRLRPESARRAAWAAALLGSAALLWVEPLSALLAALALGLYVWAYTPLKRRTPHAMYVGAVPGAIPPLIGYAAASQEGLDALAWSLFGLLLVWQLPHFLAIAIFRREEYQRAGFRVFGVEGPQRPVRLLMVGWGAVLVAVSLLPALLGFAGRLYLSAAIGFGVAFLAGCAYGLRPDAGTAWARSLFFATMPYLVLLFVGLAL